MPGERQSALQPAVLVRHTTTLDTPHLSASVWNLRLDSNLRAVGFAFTRSIRLANLLERHPFDRLPDLLAALPALRQP